MTLREKTLVPVGATLVGLILLLGFAGKAALLRDFRNLEEATARRDVGRAVNALSGELDTLVSQALDWSAWDDTFKFVADGNEEYTASNLTESSFANIRVNLMVFMQPGGEIVAARCLDLATQKFGPLPLLFQQNWTADHPLLQRALTPEGVTGLLVLSEGPLLLAGRPIVNSAGEGPAHGAFFIGILLDAAKIEHLSQATSLGLSFERFDAFGVPQELLLAAAAGATPPPIVVRRVGTRDVAGYTLVRDVYAQPALVLQVRRPRDIYSYGVRSADSLVLVALIVGGILALLVLLLIERLVVGPVRRLSDEVHAIGTRQIPGARVMAQSRDEIGGLAASINGMLAAQERAHRELTDSEERFRSLFENARDAIFWADPDSGVLLNCNRAAEALVGRSKAELLGRPQTILYPPQKTAEYAALFRSHRLPAADLHEDFEVITRSGGVRSVDISHCITHAGSQRIMQGIFHDTTERRRAEQQLRDTNTLLAAALAREQQSALQLEAAMQQLRAAMLDARAADESKSQFLASMSHEIRTPLTAINGFAELIAEEIGVCAVCPTSAAGDLRQNLGQYVETIRSNGQHLLTLINDILDLSKVEAGKLEVEHIPCDLGEVIAGVQALIQPRAREKQLSFGVEYIGRLPKLVRTDPTRVRQILLNLLGNAVKFTERGGVRLVVRYCATAQQPELCFEVHDSGIGMAPAHLSRIFQPFMQADATAARRFGGTGLGLAISRRLAEALGGGLVVESKPGQGSVFRARLVVGAVDEAATIEPPAETSTAEPAVLAAPLLKLSGRILLAEDGPDNQRLISLILRKAGATVTVADDGQAALDMAWMAQEGGHPFDLILMDIQMPVLNGYEATRRLRRRGYTRPIVALTAFAMARVQEECLAAGCDDYCTKPIDRRALLKTIARHLGAGAVT